MTQQWSERRAMIAVGVCTAILAVLRYTVWTDWPFWKVALVYMPISGLIILAAARWRPARHKPPAVGSDR